MPQSSFSFTSFSRQLSADEIISRSGNLCCLCKQARPRKFLKVISGSKLSPSGSVFFHFVVCKKHFSIQGRFSNSLYRNPKQPSFFQFFIFFYNPMHPSKVIRVGNSLYVRISKEILLDMGLLAGSLVYVFYFNKLISISKEPTFHGKKIRQY